MFTILKIAQMLQMAGLFDAAVAEPRAALQLNPDDPLGHYNLALVLFNRGRWDEAVAELRETIRLKPDDAAAHFYLGNNLLCQGKLDEAIAAYRRAQVLPRVQVGGGGTDWYSRRLADGERLAALRPRLPALLRGDDRPRDNQERLDIAWLCMLRRLYAASARLHAEALEADPTLADSLAARQDRWRWYVYRGARSAALAGCGQGEDTPPPDDAARARLRAQALGWLKSELVAWSKLLDSDNSHDPILALSFVAFWKTNPDLALVRDADALAKLPEPERTGWTALWAEVDALLAKARGDRP
jgi:tetratricopeptide (TPR) repeat protein